MSRFNVSILEYLGQLDIGILVLVSIVYDGDYYESTFFYTDSEMVLTISEDLENILGYKIDKDPEYADLLSDILKRLIPFNEMYNRLDEVDFSKWSQYDEVESNNDEVEYLDIKNEDQNGESSS